MEDIKGQKSEKFTLILVNCLQAYLVVNQKMKLPKIPSDSSPDQIKGGVALLKRCLKVETKSLCQRQPKNECNLVN